MGMKKSVVITKEDVIVARQKSWSWVGWRPDFKERKLTIKRELTLAQALLKIREKLTSVSPEISIVDTALVKLGYKHLLPPQPYSFLSLPSISLTNWMQRTRVKFRK
jgi:hypothetical protein